MKPKKTYVNYVCLIGVKIFYYSDSMTIWHTIYIHIILYIHCMAQLNVPKFGIFMNMTIIPLVNAIKFTYINHNTSNISVKLLGIKFVSNNE